MKWLLIIAHIGHGGWVLPVARYETLEACLTAVKAAENYPVNGDGKRFDLVRFSYHTCISVPNDANQRQELRMVR